MAEEKKAPKETPTPAAAPISLSMADLQSLMATMATTIVSEMRKPSPLTDAQLAQIAQDQEHRKANAQSILDQMEQKTVNQAACTHEHSKRDGGQTHCVWVQESFPLGSHGYILCQHCSIRIRPESASKKLDPGAAYNTPLYNRLWQECATND